jgi:phenylpropionate dioxygenase-like ring-hydroxylating dioxygenase large terminal subunit
MIVVTRMPHSALMTGIKREDQMFLTDCWQVAAYSAEVTGHVLSRTLVDVPVLLYRSEAGEVVAMQDRCPHRYLPLSLGRKHGDIIECGYHGLRFGPSGHCVHVPGQLIIPERAKVPVYPSVEKYRLVWIWMGDAAKADPALIPDFHWLDDPAWAVAEGYHFIAADYRFLVDNLLDLSHETFVHPETIGNGAVADSPVSAGLIDGKTVRVHRDMFGCEPPPQFVALGGFTGLIDRWHTTFYTPPGFCIIEVGAVPAGETGNSNAFEARILNLITPATEKSSHYFWAHARDVRRDDEGLTEAIRASIVATFNQDKFILEAQQIESDRVGSVDPGVVLGFDVGSVLGRRVLRSAINDASVRVGAAL